MPISTVAERLISEVAVSVFSTLSSKPLHAAAEDFFLALLRVVSLHHANASQRFGEPARHFRVDLRSRAVNRANHLERAAAVRMPKTIRPAAAAAVIVTLDPQKVDQRERSVMIPPTKSISPVPIRFRTPSTSLMMRETSTPVLFES